MKDRVRQIMESMNMTQQVFAQFIEMSPASLSSIFNGRTRPTLNIVEAIKKKIPNINTDWLMFGEGSMYVQSESGGLVEHIDGGDVLGEAAIDFELPSSPTSQAGHTTGFNAHSAGTSDSGMRNTRAEIVREEVKYIDKPQRKITEIRIYFDDLTYETFVPSKSH